MSVLYLPEVRFYFKELAQILFQENYFGIEKNAIKYVEELFNDINTLLPVKPKRPAPEYFNNLRKRLILCNFQKE
ncbi:hypothetical protein AGMMS49574_29740 [Bacteroidia bacterium]|nr:hypothetical protein AGMMS49574_29740 [Bacteroidia bacterium]GHV04092.1 hypothetical protein FACS189416_1720 [Bacteroidia bacterium]